MFQRLLKPTKSASYFLFGARGTGKTTLLHDLYQKTKSYYIDLLEPSKDLEYLRDPERLSREIAALPKSCKVVIIDEIQKVPMLLDVVHQQIEETKRNKREVHFVLTGSSARKLKRGAANLLAGRAFVYNLYPLIETELGQSFKLQEVLEYGTLPQVFSYKQATDKRQYLNAYANTYLKEEIWSEQIVRKLEPFNHFLAVAAQGNGKIINYNNIAKDILVDSKTVQSYYQILEDTLLGFFLKPYHRSLRKREVQSPKFYLFDNGVKRALDRTLNVPLNPQTYAYGEAFEHFLISEIYRRNAYQQLDYSFFFIKTYDGAEVDLVIERPGMPTALVEIKSTTKVDPKDVRHLEGLGKDFQSAELFCLSLDKQAQKIGNTSALHWLEGLKELGL